MKRFSLLASLLLLVPPLHATTIAPIDVPMLSLGCTRTTRESLSPVAAEVLRRIEGDSDAMANLPLPGTKILSTCNAFDGLSIDGPNIFYSARDVIATADHEVDIAFFQWDRASQGAKLIGDGLIAAQARRTAADPLLVRIVIDDVLADIARTVNHMYDSEKDWVSRGLDLTRVKIQLAVVARHDLIEGAFNDKFIVVDARSLLVTGTQPQPTSDAYTVAYRSGWHDSGYLFEGDAAQSALASFEHTWYTLAQKWDCYSEASAPDCGRVPDGFQPPNHSWIPPFSTQTPGDIPILTVGRLKGGAFNNETHNAQDIAWLTVLDRATTQVSIESPNINDDAFRAAVVRAVGRGVTVRLITSLGFNDKSEDLPSQGGDNMEVVGNLRKEIRASFPQYQDRFQLRWYSRYGWDPVVEENSSADHTKYLTADGNVAVVGSGNMDTASWNLSHEFNVLIDDAGVTSSLDQSLFQPDWNKSIGSYLELYEGNGGTQDVVCPIAITATQPISFGDPIDGYDYRCDNDEARSMLLHDVPAGKVLTFYDDPSGNYRRDDWTEVFVKRAVSRKYLDTFERSFEDDDLRVVYHRNDGLDGKISAATIKTSGIGAVVDLYEGNNATQNKVCSKSLAEATSVYFQSDADCANDEARSLVMYDWPADKALFVYDDPSGARTDDYTVIIPKHALTQLTVGSFESSYQNTDVRVCAVHFNGIDGKVSRMRVGSITEATSYCPPNNTGGGSGGGTQPQ